jgi:hypothetical protein
VRGEGNTYGVHGLASGSTGVGVFGQASAAMGIGVEGTAPALGARGIANATSGVAYGVYGRSSSSAGYGVFGVNEAATGTSYGVFGLSNSSSGVGVRGEGGSSGRGVVGFTPSGGFGVLGQETAGGSGAAGRFEGDVQITHNLSKGSGSFKIDHPLDPENRYLYHSFVESPDMMNVYNGNVRLDTNGEAWVELPEWFEALNRDFRYQLTCIGGFAPVYVAEEIAANRFKIAGGREGMKVSWQVTGIRQDPFANAYRIPVEQVKPAEERGTYLHPEAWGQPEERGLSWRLHEPYREGQQLAPSPTPR